MKMDLQNRLALRTKSETDLKISLRRIFPSHKYWSVLRVPPSPSPSFSMVQQNVVSCQGGDYCQLLIDHVEKRAHCFVTVFASGVWTFGKIQFHVPVPKIFFFTFSFSFLFLKLFFSRSRSRSRSSKFIFHIPVPVLVPRKQVRVPHVPVPVPTPGLHVTSVSALNGKSEFHCSKRYSSDWKSCWKIVFCVNGIDLKIQLNENDKSKKPCCRTVSVFACMAISISTLYSHIIGMGSSDI